MKELNITIHTLKFKIYFDNISISFLHLVYNLPLPQSTVLRTEVMIKLFIKSFAFDRFVKTPGNHNGGEWSKENFGSESDSY